MAHVGTYWEMSSQKRSAGPIRTRLIQSPRNYSGISYEVTLNFIAAQVEPNTAETEFRKADINLLSRFQTLIETSFYDQSSSDKRTHSPSFYANELAIHPNYLNAIVKQITGHTAKSHIHNHLLSLAKSRLMQTDMSIKELAYSLHFDSPNNFSSFFKKQTGETPNMFRKSN